MLGTGKLFHDQRYDASAAGSSLRAIAWHKNVLNALQTRRGNRGV
jgi:hypothetical protein